MSQIRLIFIAFVAVILTSCGSLTDIQGSWSNSSYTEKKISKIAVFTVGAKSFIAEATMETAVAKAFNDRGVTATAGTDMFQRKNYDADGDGKVDDPNMREKMASKLSELGFDGVLVVAVKDVTEEERWVPGTVTYQPRSYYNGWYNYWNTTYERTETPGYMAKDVNAYLEANLYSLSDDGLAYAAQTQTFNPTSLQDAADSFSDAVVPDIIGKDIVQVNEK